MNDVSPGIMEHDSSHKGIIPPRLMNYEKKIFTRVHFIFSVDRARDHYSIADAGMEIVRGLYSLVQNANKHSLHNRRRVHNLSQ